MRRVILVGDLVARVQSYFAPRLTEVEFYEDWSGVDYIRVQNPDGTFELFQHETSPSAEELILQVLAAANITGVTGFEVAVDRHVMSERERAAKQSEIARKYGLSEDLTPGEWGNAPIDEALRETALADWEQWFDFHMPVELLE